MYNFKAHPNRFRTILLFICMTIANVTVAQILSIQCYNQNVQVLTDTNNLVLNGGFENTNCIAVYAAHSFCPNSTIYDCDIINWTCTGGGTNTYACMMDTSQNSRTIIIEGIKATYFGNGFCNSCSGTQSDLSCIVDSSCQVIGIPTGYPFNGPAYGGNVGVSLSQIVNGLIAGNIYELEFWAGGESYNSIFSQSGLFAVDLGFGNIFLKAPPTPRNTGIGKRYVISFIATSSSHTIKFTNWGHIGVNSNNDFTELILDDVRLFATQNTSINNIAGNLDITIFPNPFADRIYIAVKCKELLEINLFDLTSKKIIYQKFTNSVSLNTEQLAKGIYIYQVRSNKGAIKKGKIVKD